MNIDEFKKIKITAMKEQNKDKVSALNLIINKLMMLSIEKKGAHQEMTDADTTTVLKKSIKELEEEREGFVKAGRQENVASLTAQIEYVNTFLPKMMSEEEIKAVILSLDDKSVPAVMKHFKANYAGNVDMGTVNKVLRTL